MVTAHAGCSPSHGLQADLTGRRDVCQSTVEMDVLLVKRINFKGQLLPLLLWLLLGAAQPAWATQVHAAPEGLYAHQLAHVFLTFSMGILIYWLRERKLVLETGWRYVQYAAFFLILWNLDAMTVHYLDSRDDMFRIVNAGGWQSSIQVSSQHSGLILFYYFAKMDHLLCVPAIIFLYLGLRHLLRQAATMKVKDQRS